MLSEKRLTTSCYTQKTVKDIKQKGKIDPMENLDFMEVYLDLSRRFENLGLVWKDFNTWCYKAEAIN